MPQGSVSHFSLSYIERNRVKKEPAGDVTLGESLSPSTTSKAHWQSKEMKLMIFKVFCFPTTQGSLS